MTGWANFSFFSSLPVIDFLIDKVTRKLRKTFSPNAEITGIWCYFLKKKKCKKREELAESLPSSLFTRNYFLLLDTGPSCSAVFPLLLTVNNFQLVLTLFAHEEQNCFVSAECNERNRWAENVRPKQSSFVLGTVFMNSSANILIPDSP